MPSKAKATATTDHKEIQQWAAERGAKPAHVRNTGDAEDVGVLRLEFPGYTGEDKLESIEWDIWFEKFDERGLALLHQQTTAGGERSNFNKLVNRNTVETAASKPAPKSTAKGLHAVASRGTASKTSRAGTSKSAAASRTASRKAAAKQGASKPHTTHHRKAA